ncbi:MAG: VOC family protein [Intrasporangiaceae bacterium]|nr:VOC family protein [Intrasporangiaceae bacterium]
MTDDTADVRPLLLATVLDCPDPQELASFYAALLGWEVEPSEGDEWVDLVAPNGHATRENPDGGRSLSFQRVADYVAPTWPTGSHPQQMHLDLGVDDIDAAEPAVLALGGRVAEEQPSEDGGFKVYLDPAGHPFCLCRQAAE